MSVLMASPQVTNLRELRESGWTSRTVKREMRDNLLRLMATQEPLFPGIVGYEDTVIPEIVLAILAEHDILFLGEKRVKPKTPDHAAVDPIFRTSGLRLLIIPNCPFTKIPKSRSRGWAASCWKS